MSAPRINESHMKIITQIFRRPNAKRQAKAQADEKAMLPVHVKTIKEESTPGMRQGYSLRGCQAASARARQQIESKLRVAAWRTNKLQSLKGPHRDARVMRDLLISELDYFLLLLH